MGSQQVGSGVQWGHWKGAAWLLAADCPWVAVRETLERTATRAACLELISLLIPVQCIYRNSLWQLMKFPHNSFFGMVPNRFMLEVTQVEGNRNVCAATMIVYTSVLGPQVLLVQRRAVPRLSLKLHVRF